jgi:hypothetical protein
VAATMALAATSDLNQIKWFRLMPMPIETGIA